MAAENVALNIVLGSRDETGPGVASAESKLEQVKGKVASLQAAWAGFGAATATAVGFLSDAAQASADDAASTDRLRQAVENSGATWDATQGKINARIAANQQLAFSDDETRDSLSILVAETGNLEDAMRRQKLAMDFARGAHIDLTTASKLLGKASDENVNVLARYGIHVQKGADTTELFGQVQAKYGGQAETYGNSTAGSIAKVKDQVSEWRESIGYALGPAQGLIALLPGMSAGFTLAGTVVGPLSSGIVALGNSSVGMAVKTAIVRAATLAWTAVQWLLNVALSANPIGLVVLAIAALVGGVIWAYQNVGWFRDAVNTAWAGLQSFGNWIWSNLKPILDWLGQNIGNIGSLLISLGTFNISGVMGALHNLHVPGFAEGGRVPGPRGTPLLAIVHGGEYVVSNDDQVVPLGAGGAGGGSSPSVLHVHTFLNGREIAEAVYEVADRDRRLTYRGRP